MRVTFTALVVKKEEKKGTKHVRKKKLKRNEYWPISEHNLICPNILRTELPLQIPKEEVLRKKRNTHRDISHDFVNISIIFTGEKMILRHFSSLNPL